MSGGRSAKRKGTRVERELVQLLCELGLPCARVPLSGAIGGAWSGDIHLELCGRTHKIEVKTRREFRTLQQRLANADLLLLKADRQPPLAVLPLALLAELIVGRS
jgi:Holliday junction resolvase